MDEIKKIIADFDAFIKRIEIAINPHLLKGQALEHMDKAKAALEQHPDAVTPAPAPDASAATPATANDVPASPAAS